MAADVPSRDDLASSYLDQLPFDPYPVQEEALLAWFSDVEGVLVCTPTGTGKTLIAEAAAYEALHTGSTIYYTTPLIALTEQKFHEMQEAAVRWGFHPDQVGLVTGNRRVNPNAQVLVVVAEILLNRLLHTSAFDFSNVSAVVMDEFHNFSDRERGIVWELTLGLLPKHARLLLLSATVGNAVEFQQWLKNAHGRYVQLVRSDERKVPLEFHWVGEELLADHVQEMAAGDDASRRTPALVFCFNREECWTVAEQLKGKKLLADDQQKRIGQELDKHDWSKGAGPKLKRILLRGVGVHHAGVLPKYRRIVEHLFQKKLLSVCLCTETLSAGINLPARSVVMTTLLKGPPGKKVLIDASRAHQIFGRAGRPQFDSKGYVYAVAHEDDVKIARWQEKYDQIPEDTKDPNLRRAKKSLKKKQPTRRKNQQYWTEQQFAKLQAAPPGNLSSRGPLSWRLLAYLLDLSPDVDRIRRFVHSRLLSPKQLEKAEKHLESMLMSLWAGGYVTLEPEPPSPEDEEAEQEAAAGPEPGSIGALMLEQLGKDAPNASKQGEKKGRAERREYRPETAKPTEALARLLGFRSINPLYGDFLTQKLGAADETERIQAFESVLGVAGSLVRLVRVPRLEDLPPGQLATESLDSELLTRGLALPQELTGPSEEELKLPPEERIWAIPFAEKLYRVFQADFPEVHDVVMTPVWIVGELLRFGGDFNKLVTSKDLTKQEGIVFRHLLRFILLMEEFAQDTPPQLTAEEWQAELRSLADRVTETCRTVDPESTDKAIESAHGIDLLAGEGLARATDG